MNRFSTLSTDEITGKIKVVKGKKIIYGISHESEDKLDNNSPELLFLSYPLEPTALVAIAILCYCQATVLLSSVELIRFCNMCSLP